MKIIMVAGEAGAGKDTFYQLARKKFNTVRWAFADKLKEIAKEMCWDGEKDKRGRQLLIDIGTIGRKYDLSCWANVVADEIECIVKNPCNVEFIVITDFRYENEYKVLADRFGAESIYTVRVVRPNYNNSLTPEQRADESETGLDKFQFDAWLINDDLELYERKINFILDTAREGERTDSDCGKNSKAS